MKNKITKKEKGFTIIEVLVTVVIIGILVTGAVIKREKSINIKRAQIRAQQVKDMIELTKDYALTGETVTGGAVPQSVPQYFVFSVTDGKTYKIGSLNPNNDVINLKTVTVPATENVLLDNTTIQFTAPHADMTCTDCEIRVCGDNACTDADTIFTIKVTDYSIGIIN